MSMISEILSRTELQQIRSFLLEGIDCGELDHRDYETRIREPLVEMSDLLNELLPDPVALDRLAEKIFAYSCECGNVYMEIGLRAGAKLTIQAHQNIAGM